MRGKAGGALRALLLPAALLVGFAGASAHAATTATPPTLKIEVIGTGRVTGLGLNCGLGSLTCYSAYGTVGQAVTLTATASAGWTFSGWEDDASGCAAAPSCLVPGGVTGDKTATAVFQTTAAVHTSTFGVSLASPANGSVTNTAPEYPIDCPGTPTECSLTVVQGSTLTVVEQPDPAGGYFFGGWGGACSGTAVSCSVYLTADKFVGANFVSTTPNTLTVTVTGNGTVTGGGIVCGAGATCDAQEPPNANVTLTATPQSGYAFTGWGGACTASQGTCTVQMDAPRDVTATFAQVVPLSVTVSGDGTVSGAGFSCGPGPQTCTGGETPNATITLTGTATTSGGTVSWSGCTSTAGAVCSVTLGTTATSVTATFAGGTAPPSTATNSLQIKVQGGGYVVSTTGNTSIYCTAAGGNGCNVNVQANTSLTLSAVPASGSTGDFLHWANDCASFTTTSCNLTMTGPKNVEADFAGGNQTYMLNGQVVGSGTITGAGLNCTTGGGGSGCNVQQAASATVTLTASPAAGATFTGWSGACSGTSPSCTVSMTNTKAVTATFTSAGGGGGGGGGATEDLAIEVSGAGSVTDLRGACTSTAGKNRSCTQAFPQGEAVTLSAKAAPGFVFTGWTGACSGTKTTCGVSMRTCTTRRRHVRPYGSRPDECAHRRQDGGRLPRHALLLDAYARHAEAHGEAGSDDGRLEQREGRRREPQDQLHGHEDGPLRLHADRRRQGRHPLDPLGRVGPVAGYNRWPGRRSSAGRAHHS